MTTIAPAKPTHHHRDSRRGKPDARLARSTTLATPAPYASDGKTFAGGGARLART